MLPHPSSFVGRTTANDGLDLVERGDTLQRFRRDRRRPAGSKLVEPSADMSPTEGETHLALLGERLVASVAIDLQDAIEALKMLGRTHRLSIRCVDVGDRRRITAAEGTIIASVGEELAGLGSPASRIEDRRSRFVGEQLRRSL